MASTKLRTWNSIIKNELEEIGNTLGIPVNFIYVYGGYNSSMWRNCNRPTVFSIKKTKTDLLVGMKTPRLIKFYYVSPLLQRGKEISGSVYFDIPIREKVFDKKVRDKAMAKTFVEAI